MRYVGGKSRISEWVTEPFRFAPLLYEPFVGGFNIAKSASPQRLVCSDVNRGLIDLYNAVKIGWVPPRTVSEAEYYRLRCGESCPLKTYVSYAASFGGKEWGGFARHKAGSRDLITAGYAQFVSKIPWIKRATFQCCSYTQLVIEAGATIYCDPPYEGTLDYGTGWFDSRAFVSWCNLQADRGCRVFVSEFRNLCPERWKILASRSRAISLGNKKRKTELLMRVTC